LLVCSSIVLILTSNFVAEDFSTLRHLEQRLKQRLIALFEFFVKEGKRNF